MSALSSSPYNRGTLVAATTSTNGRETDCNKLVFYQIQIALAPFTTILDSRADGDADQEDGSAAN